MNARAKIAAPRGKSLAQRRAETDWNALRALINEYVEAEVADSWKGGGDPADAPVVEANLALALAKLNAHIERMQRELT